MNPFQLVERWEQAIAAAPLIAAVIAFATGVFSTTT